MTRRLPPQYAGWESHERAFRRLTTRELIAEIQDGPPDRRLAALSLVDLSQVDQPIIEDWVRTLPDTEANELAGSIPLQRPHSSCREDLRWVQVARLGYERRKLATFLVMLLSSMEALEARGCPETGPAWEEIAEWLGSLYDRFSADSDRESLDDISLFVLENYLDRDALFEAFTGMLCRNESLAREVSLNPSHLLGGLPEAKQRVALLEAETAGGIPFRQSWAALHNST